MASQKQGRGTTGQRSPVSQQGSGRPPGSGPKAGRPGGAASAKGRDPGRQPRSAAPPNHDRLAEPLRPMAPSWLQLTTLILSLGGLGVSIYLTIAHYTSTALLLCPANSFINCGEVTSSSESMVFGVFPVALLGLLFYVFMVAINSPWAWRSDYWAIPRIRLGSRPVTIRWIRIGAAITGIGFVLYLVYAELIQIGKICEYCTAVHIITFILFTLIVFDASFRTSTTAATARR